LSHKAGSVPQLLCLPIAKLFVRIDRLIELINAKVDDPTWGRACVALKECLYVSGTATYVRFYERIGQTEKYKLINLDLAGVSA
jgi:hypothetical protein